MTTVAFRGKTLATDSQASYGDWKVPGNDQKLWRLKDGSVAATTGSVALGLRTLAWIEGGRQNEQPQPPADNRAAAVLLLHKNGRLEVFEDGAAYFERAPFMAYGSGQPAALAALHMGADAKRAVQIAMLVDKHSGGAVRTMSVGSRRGPEIVGRTRDGVKILKPVTKRGNITMAQARRAIARIKAKS